MTEPFDFEAWLLANLPFIERTLAIVARRQGIRGDDAEDFAAWAKGRLCENEYALLRKWRGESKLGTYVAVVAMNLAREHRIRDRGRWRASAAAERLGGVAVRLEQLVYRDGLSLREAGETMRTRRETTLTDRELSVLLGELPRRGQRGEDHEVPIDRVTDGRAADDVVMEKEVDAERSTVGRTLDAALRRLDPLEETVVRMHFLQGYTLADIARALGVEQRPLYRVKDAALRKLRRALLDAGITWEGLREYLGGALPPDDETTDDPGGGDTDGGAAPGGSPARHGPPGKTGGPRPSNESCDSTPSDRASESSDSARSERSDT